MNQVNKNRYDRLKYTLDTLGASILLFVLSPVLLGISILVLIFSGPPIIFAQKRLTLNGKEFVMYKFRTMVNSAEDEPSFSPTEIRDERITFLGRILRFSRLDELPQLGNVILGDMSLVGPRPERPELTKELSLVIPSFKRRLDVRAGITGLAQTETGYASSIEAHKKKVAYDILYIRKRSLTLDTIIALRTLVVMITGKGAR